MNVRPREYVSGGIKELDAERNPEGADPGQAASGLLQSAAAEYSLGAWLSLGINMLIVFNALTVNILRHAGSLSRRLSLKNHADLRPDLGI